jgi:hypothetical protein
MQRISKTTSDLVVAGYKKHPSRRTPKQQEAIQKYLVAMEAECQELIKLEEMVNAENIRNRV